VLLKELRVHPQQSFEGLHSQMLRARSNASRQERHCTDEGERKSNR
jgi:hypothetical protein